VRVEVAMAATLARAVRRYQFASRQPEFFHMLSDLRFIEQFERLGFPII
jgi:hypothetical protein